MAHTLSGRSRDARDISHDGLGHKLADELRGRLFVAATDLTNEDDSFGTRVALEQLQYIDEIHPTHRVAANTDTRALTQPDVGRLIDRLVGQRAGARHDSNRALLVNEARHDPDLALFRCDDTRTIRAHQPRARTCEHRLHAHHIVDRH